MKKKISQFLPLIFTGMIVINILIGTLRNADLAYDALRRTISEGSGLDGMIKNTTEMYSDGFNPHNDYINLNGMFVKLTGRRVYNEVASLDNGMLINDVILADMDTKTASRKTYEFAEFIHSTGGEFLYVQAPYKLDINNELLPVGVENSSNLRSDNMIRDLNELGVNTLDLRQTMAKDAESIEKYFYVTDHHWNTYGGFTAFNLICDKIRTIFPDITLNETALDEENWDVTVYEDWFLGSHGKRLGKYYAGVDDLSVYKPKFDTDMSLYIVNHRRFIKGDFTKVNIREEYLDEPDYFNENAYCVYLGGDYQLTQQRNNDALCDMKVLILKDSFTLPVQAFMSTVFTQLDVIDPRYFTESTLAEYVELNRPDLVIMLLNPWSMNGASYYNTGAKEAESLLSLTETALVYDEDYSISAEEKDSAKATVYDSLKADTKYSLEIDSINVKEGDADAAMIVLYDNTNSEVVTSRCIDIGYQSKNGEYSFSFITPEEDNTYSLYIYAGTEAETAGNTLLYEGVSLYEYK